MLITRPRTIVAQVEEILRQRIFDDVYAPGSRLPSENELLQEFDVSRATIRSALTKLAADGLILRKQGDGTYVNERVQTVNAQLSGFWDYMRLIERSGHEASIRLLSMEVRAGTAAETAVLDLAPGADVLSLHRLLLADNQPAIVTTNAFPADKMTDSEITRFDGQLHIQSFTQVYFGQRIAYSILEVHPILPTMEVAQTLHIPTSTPILSLNSTFYNRKNEPIIYGISYHDDLTLSLRLMQAWE
ncbi:MAG: GntR family transcriptional regulator [Anaerolineales bacterium]|nr:GntR family transcriptional regulator [Anaerolineales bacterium]MCA9932089.1 GntR family transcriptional regulator [Anaerolineales bacterium]